MRFLSPTESSHFRTTSHRSKNHTHVFRFVDVATCLWKETGEARRCETWERPRIGLVERKLESDFMGSVA